MSIFKTIELSFKNKSYKIEPTNVMRCLAQIEDVISLQDLSNANRVPLVKLSQAYAIALRHAGASVTDEDVYESVFEDGGAAMVSAAVGGLLSMMIPPAKFQASIAAKKPRAATKNPRAKAKN